MANSRTRKKFVSCHQFPVACNLNGFLLEIRHQPHWSSLANWSALRYALGRIKFLEHYLEGKHKVSVANKLKRLYKVALLKKGLANSSSSSQPAPKCAKCSSVPLPTSQPWILLSSFETNWSRSSHLNQVIPLWCPCIPVFLPPSQPWILLSLFETNWSRSNHLNQVISSVVSLRFSVCLAIFVVHCFLNHYSCFAVQIFNTDFTLFIAASCLLIIIVLLPLHKLI